MLEADLLNLAWFRNVPGQLCSFRKASGLLISFCHLLIAGRHSSNAYVRAALAEFNHAGKPRRCCDSGADLADFIVCADGTDYSSLFANHFVHRSDEEEDD